MGLTGASAANLKLSLEKYIYDNLYSVEDLDIDYEGLAFDDTVKTEWVQPRILDITSQFIRQSSSSKYGESANVLFQIGIFVKKGKMTSVDRCYRIRDMVAKYFKVGKDISLYDYINDDSELCKMRIRDVVNDDPMPEEKEYFRHILAIEIEYVRETTKP